WSRAAEASASPRLLDALEVPSLDRIAAPHPDQRVGERAVLDVAVAMSGVLTDHVTIVVALGLERGGGALVGQHPVVMPALGGVVAGVAVLCVPQPTRRVRAPVCR